MGQEYSREIIVRPYGADGVASPVSVKCRPICNFRGETKAPVGAFPFYPQVYNLMNVYIQDGLLTVG